MRARHTILARDDAATNGLRDGAARLGVVLDESQESKLARYLELLLTWNRKINLTAVTEPAASSTAAFSTLAVVRAIPAGARSDLDRGAPAAGSRDRYRHPRGRSAGHLRRVISKKAAFVGDAVRGGWRRASKCSRRDSKRIAADRTIDVAVSRATWEPAEWLVRGAPVGCAGRRLIANDHDEVAALAAPASFGAPGADAYKSAASPATSRLSARLNELAPRAALFPTWNLAPGTSTWNLWRRERAKPV
jgi:16S rRNA (guanine527-N7)-methyltransferase